MSDSSWWLDALRLTSTDDTGVLRLRSGHFCRLVDGQPNGSRHYKSLARWHNWFTALMVSVLSDVSYDYSHASKRLLAVGWNSRERNETLSSVCRLSWARWAIITIKRRLTGWKTIQPPSRLSPTFHLTDVAAAGSLRDIIRLSFVPFSFLYILCFVCVCVVLVFVVLSLLRECVS